MAYEMCQYFEANPKCAVLSEEVYIYFLLMGIICCF